MINYKRLISALIILTFTGLTIAQTSTNSPYTRYGFGSLADQGFGNSKAMGGIAYGLRNGYQINASNPASYTAVDSLTFLFDAGMTLQNANFKEGNIKTNAKNSSFDYLAMQFRLWKRMGMAVGFLPFSTVGYSLSNTSELTKDEDGTVLQTMLEIEREMKNKQNYYSAIANLLTKKLLYQILRTTKNKSDDKADFKYILNYIEASANQKISVRQIAYNLGYNYDYLRQLFLKQTGKTAKDYLTNLRLNSAKQYLANFDYSLEEIAAMTGFSSPSHLCMTFKKHFGISPLAFKEADSKNNKTDNLKNNI